MRLKLDYGLSVEIMINCLKTLTNYINTIIGGLLQEKTGISTSLKTLHQNMHTTQ